MDNIGCVSFGALETNGAYGRWAERFEWSGEGRMDHDVLIPGEPVICLGANVSDRLNIHELNQSTHHS